MAVDFQILGSLSGIMNKATSGASDGDEAQATGPAFADLVQQGLMDTIDAQKTAESMTEAVAAGEDIPMHEVVQAVGKAEMLLETAVTVRDRAVQAYQEVFRMPI